MPTISQPPPLPGFGFPLDSIPDDEELFPNTLDPDIDLEFGEWRARFPALTLREIAMVESMNQITDKHDWEHKIFDDAIARKWLIEAYQLSDADFTWQMVRYCIDELKYMAELYAKTGFIKVYNGDVIKSDVAIPAELQAALKAAIAPLENVRAREQDWHPGSDGKVHNLVHPSLFPLVYGLSHIINHETIGIEDCISRCGEGEVISEPPGGEQSAPYSRKFQWLPCDVDISGNTPKIISYINNLHPQDHTGLYDMIEKIIEKVIPLWNATLTSVHNSEFPRRIEYANVEYIAFKENSDGDMEEVDSSEDEGDYWDNSAQSILLENIVLPNPSCFHPPKAGVTEVGRGDTEGHRDVDLKADYGATGLQIIVKLANIHLTPEKPAYEGGTWHVEGQANEHICATATYYYDNENISPSYLVFRQSSDTSEFSEIRHKDEDRVWLGAVFGLEKDESAVQEVGSVEAREGRVITFPNTLQHEVLPFELADLTKPGHRKALTLFLVDPNIKIISTANVPCQQRDWWGRILTSGSEGLARLPVELRVKVVKEVEDFPISLERAKQLREELMAEREAYVDYQTKFFDSMTVCLGY